ncbi:GLPGLI family protein [Polaribacter sp.]|nr:GLPGLI family protein [Polaribacter sp.]
MKFLLSLLTLTLITFNSFAQKDFQGKATYMSKTTMDMSRFDQVPEARKKQIMARMKNFLEKTYTLSFTKTASTFKEDAKLDAPGASNGGGRGFASSTGQGSIYKNSTDKKIIEDIETFSKRFLIIEKMNTLKWELGSETKQIGQYTCYKATLTREDNTIDYANIFGRRGRGGRNNNNEEKKDSTETTKKEVDTPKMETITAWYTPQIPVSTGPKDYYGLPGLILEINSGRTTILCTEIVLNPNEKIEIKEPKKGKKVSREEYNEIVKEKTEELQEQFRARRNNGGGRRF